MTNEKQFLCLKNITLTGELEPLDVDDKLGVTLEPLPDVDVELMTSVSELFTSRVTNPLSLIPLERCDLREPFESLASDSEPASDAYVVLTSLELDIILLGSKM